MFVWHYTARTEHYVDVLFATTLHGLRYDDRKFNAGAICLENTSVRKKAFQVLSCVFGKIRWHYDHTCLFHCLGRCLNTQPDGSCSNSFLGTWQMLMHEKHV